MPDEELHRRERLNRLTCCSDSHAGLWLDKYLADGKDKEVRRKLVDEVAAIGEPAGYEAFYARWRQALIDDHGAQCAEAFVGHRRTGVPDAPGRMIIGLGAESVLETAVTLHRTYGVPYIPGSALKGLAAAFARQRLGGDWAADGDTVSPAYRTVFGTTEAAGYITFFDALYKPKSGHGGRALHADVLTVHHPKYYANIGVAPADWDSPNPVSFLSATGRYLVALAGPSAWVETTFQILRLALTAEGIGAKTSSGYGRLVLAPET
ncbi:MAG: type III-B CRISPR module RAMP protein Cmr6 [Chloroflexota bacterium]|nr:type III-B CRISPR module RAMP protein Cmr6 [Chloroflexota bacterium]